MAELTGKSAGVSTREIDLSGPTQISPRGVPAGVIGTAVRGPAFVPVTVATFQDFVANFGNTNGEDFGPLAVNEWMKNASAGTYVRLLGVGDGKQRDATDGAVTNAGFVVGQQLPQANGLLGRNPYNEAHVAGTTSGSLGRAYVLGCFMSQSAGSTLLSDAGILSGTNDAYPIIRGVLFAPSGVVPSLSSSAETNNAASTTLGGSSFGGVTTTNGGASIGDVVTGSALDQFVMILNGLKISDSYSNIVTASFDPKSTSYFGTVFNTDPTKIEEAGHFLYTRYDVDPAIAVITGSGIGPTGGLTKNSPDTSATLAFLLSGSAGRGTSAATTATNVGAPDFESFTDRFTLASSPFVISQQFGGSNKNVFRVHARDAGAVGNTVFKITIENVQASTNDLEKYGQFDLLVRKFDDWDQEPKVLESFRGLSLNPSSDRYVARIVGDSNSFYDFDKKAGSQKLVVEGKYPNNSQYVRIEESDDLRLGRLDATAIPVGFRGLPHLVTSGTATDGSATTNILTGTYSTTINSDIVARVVQLPVPMRETVALGLVPKKKADSSLTWGVQFEKKDKANEPNKNTSLNLTLPNLTKYFPDYHITNQNPIVSNNAGTPDIGGCVLDVDRFNNNLFTLERVEVITGSNDKPDPQQWAAAIYRRNGVQAGTMTDRDGTTGVGSRLLDPAKDFSHLPSVKYLKYTFPLQGGFDGLNIFNEAKYKMTNVAVRREMDDPNENAAASATVASVRKAIDVMEEKSDVDIKLLSLPGYRHEAITDYAIDSVERRFDALLIMDVEEKDGADAYVTSSATQVVSVTNTVSRFAARALDSSFAAAYFPDVVITDPSTKTNVVCPPSVAVLGAFALNDAVAHPWFAPAGFTRGALKSVIESQVKLNRNNLDELYSADVNPLTSFPHTPGVVVFGQKTLLAAQSALDRVNVRRLLIDVRRKVRSIANGLLFEPNREETLSRFSAAVTPVLARIQQQQGLDRFKVVIDTSTTTQVDVENNTIRGKIFLQPTRSVEFISLDFVVTNAGADV